MKLHPLSLPYRALRRSVSVASTILFIGLATSGETDLVTPVRVVLLTAGALLLAVGWEVAYYRRFDYDLADTSLDIESGVLSRRRREIPLRRVQNVDISQNVVQRALSLAVLNLETAGGGETEASLQFVGYDEAKRLQRAIQRRKRDVTEKRRKRGEGTQGSDERRKRTEGEGGAVASGDAATGESAVGRTVAAETPGAPTSDERADQWPADAEFEETELYAIRSSELLLLSAISFEPRVVGLAFFVVPLFTEVDPVSATALLGVVQLLFSVLVLWAVSAMVTFARYYDFRLTRVGDELRYERGLLQRYDGSIPLDKVQTISVGENLPMRLTGYARLGVETAGYAPGQGPSGGSEAAVPLATRRRVLALAREVEAFGDDESERDGGFGLDEFALDGFERPPKRARRRYAVRYALAVGALTAVAYGAFRVVGWPGFWYAALSLVVLAPVAAHYRWKHRGFRVGDDYVLTREGFWRRTTKVVPYYRVQTVIQRQTVFQRRWGLATVVVDTASSVGLTGRDARALDVDEDTAAELRELVTTRLQEKRGARGVSRAALE